MTTDTTTDPAAGEVESLRAEVARLTALIDTPEISDFLLAVQIEAAHQRKRWGEGHDEAKSRGDWAMLRCKLMGKLVDAHWKDDRAKYLHHLVTMAAVCFNEHRTIEPNTYSDPPAESPAPQTAGADEDIDTVEFLFNTYAFAPDETLTKDAQELKRRLLKAARIEPKPSGEQAEAQRVERAAKAILSVLNRAGNNTVEICTVYEVARAALAAGGEGEADRVIELEEKAAHYGEALMDLADILDLPTGAMHEDIVKEAEKQLAERERRIAELEAAIARGGLDLCQCMRCGKTVACIPDGLPCCDACADKEDNRALGEGA